MNTLDSPSSSGIIRLPPEPGGDDATLDPHLSRTAMAPVLTERAIPLRCGDLERLLLADARLGPDRRAAHIRLFRILGAVIHHDYLAQLLNLKELYAPLDPDTDCVNLPNVSAPLTTQSDDAFLSPFEELVLKANYRPLDLDY